MFDRVMSLRLSDLEAKALSQAAEDEGRSKGSFIRAALRLHPVYAERLAYQGGDPELAEKFLELRAAKLEASNGALTTAQRMSICELLDGPRTCEQLAAILVDKRQRSPKRYISPLEMRRVLTSVVVPLIANDLIALPNSDADPLSVPYSLSDKGRAIGRLLDVGG